MTHRALTVALYMIISLIAVVIAALLWFYGPIAGGLLRASDGEGPTAAATNGATTLAQSASTGTGGRPAGSLGPAPLPTIRPWPTMQHTPTAIPATAIPPTVVPTIAPALDPPQQVPVNGIPWESIVVMPPDVATHAREIFAAGQALGRNPHAYSKVGDSTTENPHFLARYDEGPYNLGPFAHLQAVIDHFHGSHGRDSIAVRIGLHAWTANDPTWAEAGICLPNETPVQCEIRVHNPAVVFIRLGTNDVGVGGMFDANIRQIVETAIAAGVIPIIGTKGDRHEGSNENNDILRRIAADYRLPLWDFDLVANTLPGRGLDVDAAHMLTFYAHDYNDPTAFTRGHAMHNLTALMVLDAVWREVIQQ
ncbi:protein of unknown function [Candidatus Promineifilum breve]|uniref:SGNH hydrolase-type esterase domain-containing protein n=1 Tax=Candidatus Promineifilum breve TaxID=1806508 RepID=A0A160SZA7_9CHLR|nr:hypothetical protein [Candidatus Promineifilum breve]CUS02372.2 protein of unknown function [Candidatus Promineifilum breve]